MLFYMSALAIALLGTFQVYIGERPLIDFRSDKVRALLIYLAVEAERPHRRETLAGLMWPDFTQKAAQSNLRKSLYHLRRAIDNQTPGLSDQLFTITRQTIQVNPACISADVYQFRDNLTFIKQHRHKHLHFCDDCLERLKQAAGLYRDEFAHGFSLSDASTFESWLLIQRESLHQEMLGVLEHLAASYEISGEYDQAGKYAERQITLEPWRENAYRQLMRALALDGRRSEALAQYENCRRTLWEELEVEPSAETIRLFEQIEAGSLIPKETRTSALLHHFPAQFTPFIGRESELAAVENILGEGGCRLLTLIGSGGIGKTRLSLEAARRMADNGHFTDGIYFVPLTAVTEGDAFLMTLAGQLDLSIYGRSLLVSNLQKHLAGKDILLVLDNFEQLVGESRLLSELLQDTEGFKILVSSRESLKIHAEQRLAIGSMDDESAVDLFLQAAKRIWPGYNPAEEDYRAIEEICQLVAGIPLAVEMAAGWVKSLEAGAIAEQIKSNFEILEAAGGEVPERHRSMRVVFEESWKLLRPAEQKALAQFSIFKGGFSLYAALDITDTTINEIAVLLDKSLLEYPGKSRYKLHELLRQFAQQKLNDTGSAAVRETLERSYAQYYIEMVRRSETHLYGKAPQYGMKEIESEIENIRHAWQLAIMNGQLELAAAALNGLRMYYRISDQYEKAVDQFSASVEALAGQEKNQALDRLLCRLMNTAAYFAIRVGAFDQAAQYLQSVLEKSALMHWPGIRAEAQLTRGDLYYHEGKFIHAGAILQEAIVYFESAGDKLHLAESYYKLGISFIRSNRWQDTAQILTRALNISEELSYNWAVTTCLWALGYLYRANGRRSLALDYHEKNVQLALDINYLPGLYQGYTSAGLNYEDLGYYDKAFECYELSVKYAQETGNESGLARSQGCIGRVLWKLNRLEEGLAIMEEAILVARKLGFKVHLAWKLIVKAEILFSMGRYEEAWPVNEEGLKLARETTLHDRILQGEMLRVRLLAALGRTESAVNLLNETLETAEDVFTRAAANYELWQITKVYEHAKKALTNYRLAYVEDPYIEYKERIEILEGLINS